MRIEFFEMQFEFFALRVTPLYLTPDRKAAQVKFFALQAERCELKIAVNKRKKRFFALPIKPERGDLSTQEGLVDRSDSAPLGLDATSQ